MPLYYAKTDGDINNSGSSDVPNGSVISGSAATINAAGPPTVLNLDGSPDLSGVPTDGTAAINFAAATNAQQKIFKITAKDNTAKTVTCQSSAAAAVTLTGGTSAWKIGGRIAFPGGSAAFHSEDMLVAGDIFEFADTPASRTATYWTCRRSGNLISPITLRGRSGVFPNLNCTGASAIKLINDNNQQGWVLDGLSFDSDATSGSTAPINTPSAGAWVIRNNKFIDSFVTYILASGGSIIQDNEFLGDGPGAINATGNSIIINNHIHDMTNASGYGIASTSATPSLSIIGNLIHDCTSVGISLQGNAVAYTHAILVAYNTIANCAHNGIQVIDDLILAWALGNIVYQNGNAAGEANVNNSVAGTGLMSLGGNCFYHTGGGGAANYVNFIKHATDIETDPLFTDQASDDYSLQASSPCVDLATRQLLGAINGLSHFDAGALQRVMGAGSGSGGISRARAFGGFT